MGRQEQLHQPYPAPHPGRPSWWGWCWDGCSCGLSGYDPSCSELWWLWRPNCLEPSPETRGPNRRAIAPAWCLRQRKGIGRREDKWRDGWREKRSSQATHSHQWRSHSRAWVWRNRGRKHREALKQGKGSDPYQHSAVCEFVGKKHTCTEQRKK